MFPLMIDSGAFSAHTQGKKINLRSYIKFCHRTAKLHPQAVFVNLDVIGDGAGSYQNWMTMRKAGVNAIPIYHPGSGERWLRKYVEQTDHLGLGGLVGLSTLQRVQRLDYVWETYLIDKQRMPTHKVHGMGMTSFRLMTRYPWHSVDSTSWLLTARTGNILLPRRKNGAWDFSQTPHTVSVSTQVGNNRQGKKPKRNRPYAGLSPMERKLVRDYIKSLGLQLGASCPLESGGRVLFRGVTTYYGDRDRVNLEFYARYMAHLPYPRPFLQKVRKGLGM